MSVSDKIAQYQSTQDVSSFPIFGIGGSGVGSMDSLKPTAKFLDDISASAARGVITAATARERRRASVSSFVESVKETDGSLTSLAQTSVSTEDEFSIFLRPQATPAERFSLLDACELASDCASAIVNDSFSELFEDIKTIKWNWNIYLSLTRFIGVLFRYCVLFPLRLTMFVSGMIIFAIILVLSHPLHKMEGKVRYYRARIVKAAMNYAVMCFSGVIRFHGVLPKRQSNQVFVSNHSSLLDWVILSTYTPFSVVGQQHTGWVGWFQRVFMAPLKPLWFDRFTKQDKVTVYQRMKDHVAMDPHEAEALLLFPEGTCTNNRFVCMFKKGAFSLGDSVSVVPIAIKYDSLFFSGYWNSRKESFARYILRMLTSWCLVCDIWFLKPMKIKPGEKAEHFAGRVQKAIAQKGGLSVRNWDGLLKYVRISDKFVEARQKLNAARYVRIKE
ncbi:Glycerol-3-phosphate acyltransferase 9 [Aduncisulcus paluster]|uniref:Glycerol-3-phosphate acyltransferase 9 n=1 Tax=Aduncisulcus paluster TaxID=2918883 RepID=A0ABQ5KIV7_9EUKA|nr:Glycerol-3-phosphate acyltransferase 9 [Aduncisulcus paluster]